MRQHLPVGTYWSKGRISCSICFVYFIWSSTQASMALISTVSTRHRPFLPSRSDSCTFLSYTSRNSWAAICALWASTQSVGRPLEVELRQVGLIPNIGIGGLVQGCRILWAEGCHDCDALRHIRGWSGSMCNISALEDDNTTLHLFINWESVLTGTTTWTICGTLTFKVDLSAFFMVSLRYSSKNVFP